MNPHVYLDRRMKLCAHFNRQSNYEIYLYIYIYVFKSADRLKINKVPGIEDDDDDDDDAIQRLRKHWFELWEFYSLISCVYHCGEINIYNCLIRIKFYYYYYY